jgi:hypothetical protein
MGCGKMLYSWERHRGQYGACALHAVHLRLQIHTHNMQYLLFFHCKNGCTNAPQYNAICKMTVLLRTMKQLY